MRYEAVVSQTTNREAGTACNSAEAFDKLNMKSDLAEGFGKLQKQTEEKVLKCETSIVGQKKILKVRVIRSQVS
jgi:hypothetical protein